MWFFQDLSAFRTKHFIGKKNTSSSAKLMMVLKEECSTALGVFWPKHDYLGPNFGFHNGSVTATVFW